MKNKPYFIAEIGVNHEAKINLAKKIILDAKKVELMQLNYNVTRLKKLHQNMPSHTGIKRLKKKKTN